MESFEQIVLTSELVSLAIEDAAQPCSEDSLLQNTQLQKLLQSDRPLQHTPEWFLKRKSMLTASNAASFLGKNPYCSRKRYMKKVSDELLNPNNTQENGHGFAACAWGTRHEPEAAVLYSFVTGNKCYPDDVGLVVHPKHPFIGASPDRVVADKPILIEIKAPFKRKIIPELIPPLYVPQVQVQLEVCDMDQCHFVQFVPASLCAPGVIAILLVERDRQWWDANIPVLEKFVDLIEETKSAVDDDDEPPAKRPKQEEVVAVEEDPPVRFRLTPTQQQQETQEEVVEVKPVEPVLKIPAPTTNSSGVYNVYVDSRIGVSKRFKELLGL